MGYAVIIAGRRWRDGAEILVPERRMSLMIASMAILLLLVLAPLCVPMIRSGQKKQAYILALFIFVASIGLYALWGSPRVVPEATRYHVRIQELYQQIEENSALIKQNPQNLEAWLTMAQAFSDAGNYEASARGFKQAVLLSKGHPRIIMAYAESLISQQGGMVSEQAKKSIDIALMLSPDLPLARYYNAVWLLQENRNSEAMKEMRKLYNELPEDSSLKKRMKEQIGRE
jgi:cytochrome c-type biogenesis protein CcmH